MENVILLAAKEEVGAWFHNAKEGEPIRVTFEEMVHTQQETPMQTDNSTAEEIANNTIHQKGPNKWICGYIG